MVYILDENDALDYMEADTDEKKKEILQRAKKKEIKKHQDVFAERVLENIMRRELDRLVQKMPHM